FSIADRARERRSSIGATSWLMFFAERMRAWDLEKEDDRCSWRIFSLRFHAFLAWSIAPPRSSAARAHSAFASVDSVSARSAPSRLLDFLVQVLAQCVVSQVPAHGSGAPLPLGTATARPGRNSMVVRNPSLYTR